MRYSPFFIFLLISSISFSQEKRIPVKLISPKIKSYLAINYPSVKKVRFYSEIKAQVPYVECEFKYANEEYSLLFLRDSLVEVETEISIGEIPEHERLKIVKRLDEDVVSYKVLECQKVDHLSIVKYEITIRVKGKAKVEYFFDSLGEFISKEEEVDVPIATQF